MRFETRFAIAHRGRRRARAVLGRVLREQHRVGHVRTVVVDARCCGKGPLRHDARQPRGESFKLFLEVNACSACARSRNIWSTRLCVVSFSAFLSLLRFAFSGREIWCPERRLCLRVPLTDVCHFSSFDSRRNRGVLPRRDTKSHERTEAKKKLHRVAFSRRVFLRTRERLTSKKDEDAFH